MSTCESGVFDCYSTWVFDGDRRANLLTSLESEGSNFGSGSISMTAASDSSDKADAEHIQIGASLHLALGGLQIVDLASVRRHLACIGH